MLYRSSVYTSLTEFAVIVYLCIYIPDDDLLDVETCRRDETKYYLLFITQFLELITVYK